jgi:hypothetical protein
MKCHIVPRQTRYVPRNAVPPKLANLHQIFIPKVVVFEARVEIRVVVAYKMLGVVKASESDVQSSH